MGIIAHSVISPSPSPSPALATLPKTWPPTCDPNPMAVPSDPSRKEGVHYLAKRVFPGTVVLHAVHGRFRSISSSDVVFGKVILKSVPSSMLWFLKSSNLTSASGFSGRGCRFCAMLRALPVWGWVQSVLVSWCSFLFLPRNLRLS